MRKLVLAFAALSLLAAGQASAKTTAARIGDRVGAAPIQANQLGDFGLGLVPTLLLSGAVIAVLIGAADNNSPTSP